MNTSDGRVRFDKILNFRDVGQSINYFTGQQLLRPGLIFRSARPDDATETDRAHLVEDCKIKTIIDLRTPTEHLEQARTHATQDEQSTPDLPKIPDISYKSINLNGSTYSNALIWQLSYLQIARLFGLYALGWRKEAIAILASNVMSKRGLPGLAIDTLIYSRFEIKEVFGVLCDEDSYPVLVHCTQGKDRTCLIILLVLLLCGVSEEAIGRDYKLSESELAVERDEKVAEVRSIGLPDSFADCPAEWTSTVCTYINETFGGVEKYLENCGVPVEQQRVLKSLLKADASN